jgi:hypothetical protein
MVYEWCFLNLKELLAVLFDGNGRRFPLRCVLRSDLRTLQLALD